MKLAKKLTCTALAACTALSATAAAGAAYQPEQLDVDSDPLVIPGLYAIDVTHDADAQAWFNTPLSIYSMDSSYIFDGYVMGNKSDPDGYAECQDMGYDSRIRAYVESYTGNPCYSAASSLEWFALAGCSRDEYNIEFKELIPRRDGIQQRFSSRCLSRAYL